MYTFAGFGSHVQPYNDEVSKRYAEEAIKECAKMATVEYVDWDRYEVDKDSILNIIKELK